MSRMSFRSRTYTNGNVPAAVTSELLPSGRHGTSGRARAFLRSDAAASWNRAVRDVEARTGLKLTVRGWTRTRAEQERFFHQRYRKGAHSPFGDYRRYNGATYGRVTGAAAAVPGYSNHGWGLAVDVNDFGGVGQFGNPRRAKAFPILKLHGWTETEGRRVSEPWHLVYSPAADNGAGRATTSTVKSAKSAPAPARRTPSRPPTLKRGCKRPTWTRLWKEFLRAQGVFDGNTGPGFGAPLDASTKAWQQRAGLVADGVVGPRSWYTAVQGTKPGRRGAAVRIAQRIAGLSGGAVDGVAGSVFATRWRQIQRWLGVAADASVGPRTVAALIRKG